MLDTQFLDVKLQSIGGILFFENMKGFGETSFIKASEKFVTLGEFCYADDNALKGILNSKQKECLRDSSFILDAYKSMLKSLHKIEALEVRASCFYDQSFPDILKPNCKANTIIYYDGNLSLIENCVAFIGTTRADNFGRTVAHNMAQAFSKAGFNIIAPLERGVSRSAHEGACSGSGRPVAFTASGLDKFYDENERLHARNIVENGGLLLSFTGLGKVSDVSSVLRCYQNIAGSAAAGVLIQADTDTRAMDVLRYLLSHEKPFYVPNIPEKYRQDAVNHLAMEFSKMTHREIAKRMGWRGSYADMAMQKPDISPAHVIANKDEYAKIFDGLNQKLHIAQPFLDIASTF